MRPRSHDRLASTVDFDDRTLALHCPPLTVLTLVQNAVQHGIDPHEAGGRIDVRVALHGQRVHVCVADTGVGLRSATGGLGTGLANLRERLALAFGDDAQCRLTPGQPHGTVAEVELPARKGAPA